MSHVMIMLVGLLLLLPTLLPLLSVEWWWVRVWDFPRAQLVGLYLVVIVLMLLVTGQGWASLVTSGLLALALLYQLTWIVPYLPLAPRQTQYATITDHAFALRILMANVLMTNRAFARFLAMVNRVEPDVVIITEPDAWWAEQLRVLDATFPYNTTYPLENTYGMIVYSRLPLPRSEVRFLVDREIPSIHSHIQLRSGDLVEVIAVHPRPPLPRADTAERDAELVLVGRQAKASQYATVVAGDLNDVGWSQTTSLFQQVSGLLDPRRGRGLYATYHADYPLLRYPLDHLFHSAAFRLRRMQVLDHIGSDHFPLFIELSYELERTPEQEEPHLDEVARQEAEEKLERVGKKR